MVKGTTAGQVGFYANGVAKGTSSYSYSTSSESCSDPFYLGGWPGDSSKKYLNHYGQNAGMVVSDAAMTASEVEDLYSSAESTHLCPGETGESDEEESAAPKTCGITSGELGLSTMATSSCAGTSSGTFECGCKKRYIKQPVLFACRRLRHYERDRDQEAVGHSADVQAVSGQQAVLPGLRRPWKEVLLRVASGVGRSCRASPR